MREDRKSHAAFEKIATRVAVGLVIAALPLSFITIALGAAEVIPFEFAVPATIAALLVPIGLALLIGAVGGLYLIGGWKPAPFGVLFVAGFAALVYGIAGVDPLWRLVGAGLLGIASAAFFVGGPRRGKAPRSGAGIPWGAAGTVAGGVVITVAGLLTDLWWLLLIGTMAIGCGTGFLIGGWRAARRPAPDDTPPVTG